VSDTFNDETPAVIVKRQRELIETQRRALAATEQRAERAEAEAAVLRQTIQAMISHSATDGALLYNCESFGIAVPDAVAQRVQAALQGGVGQARTTGLADAAAQAMVERDIARAEALALRKAANQAYDAWTDYDEPTPMDAALRTLGKLLYGKPGQALLAELAAARAYMEAQDPGAPLLPAEQMITLWQAWKKARKG
jgi:hypothetical protein